MEPLNIKIMSLQECFNFVKNKTNYNIISIRSSNMSVSEFEKIDKKKDNYSSIIIETFDDVVKDERHYMTPKKIQIKRILKWSESIENNFAVHCSAGVSRSAAIAYLIACQRMEKEEAIKILDFRLHCPNQLVITLGSEILKDNTLLDYYLKSSKKYYDQNKEIIDKEFEKLSPFII
jgi:predicted protein tyrosine phosphatase